MAKTAFITGANGISGSAILEYLVQNTNEKEWSNIIVSSRSPFKSTVSDPRVKFIALDFTETAETLASRMKDVCASVTHAYFCSYVHKDDFAELNAANAALFENFLDSLERVAKDLVNVTLQTGLQDHRWACVFLVDILITMNRRQVLQRALATGMSIQDTLPRNQ